MKIRVPHNFHDQLHNDGQFTVYPEHVNVETVLEDGRKVNVYLSHNAIKQMYSAVIKEGGKY